MSSKKPLFHMLLGAALMLAVPAAGALAQCYGSLMLSPGFFEFDYLVRLAIHFGDASELPEGVTCSSVRMPGAETVEVPVWFYNAHEGISRLEFGVESNDTILAFEPENGFSIYHQSSYRTEDGLYQFNVKMNAAEAVCGPAMAGYAIVRPAEASELTWIDLIPNQHTRRMFATDPYYDDHYMFSPQHGGYIGSSYLYACQEPICEEPNLPVTDLVAESGYGRSVKITWTSGEGNTTMIRARLGRYPTGYSDGRLVVQVPSTPGQRQYYYDTDVPDRDIVYYKAFSLTLDAGGSIVENSFVECAAVDTTLTCGKIAVEETSWGAIKKQLR